MSVASILTKFDDVLYTWCLIYMLAGAGIFFTIRTRFVQLRLLKDVGCDLIQGFYFSRPVPPEEFEKLIEKEIATERS